MRTYGPLEVSGPTIYPNDMPEHIIPRRNYIPYLATALAREVIQQSHHIKLPNFDQSLPNISHSMYHDYSMRPRPPGDTRFFHSFLFFVFFLRNKQQHVPRACGSLAKITSCRNTHSHPLHIPPFTHLSRICSHAPPPPLKI